MSFNSTRQTVSELLSRKGVTVVPKDQQVLLEHSNSWATNFKGQSTDWVPVPDQVLKSARDAFVRAKRKRESVPASTSQDRSALGSSPPPSDLTYEGSQPAPTQSSLKATETHPPHPSIINETPRRIPAMFPPPRPRIVEYADSPVETMLGPGMSAKTELEANENELPTTSRSPRVHFRPNIDCDFPSSWSEDDLEMQLPQAQVHKPQLSQHHVNSNVSASTSSSSLRESQTLNAPPCAQPSQQVVLNTPIERAPSPEAPLNAKRQRRMKSIDWDRSVRVKTVPDSTKTIPRMASTKTYPSVPVISSDSTTSSSIIPASFQEPPDIGDVLAATRRTSRHSASSANGSIEDEEDRISIVTKATQIASNTSTASPQNQSPAILHSIETRTSSTPDQTPYALYTSSYPSYVTEYSGSLWSFVKACLCLEYLQKTHSLRDCLWDEFIRCFSAGYLHYVESHKDPIPAIEWFNDLEGAPSYMNMVITKTSLSKVMSAYPEKIAEAKGYIKPQSGEDTIRKDHASASTTSIASTTKQDLAESGLNVSNHEEESARQGTSTPFTLNSTNVNTQNNNLSALRSSSGSKRNILADETSNAPADVKRARHSMGSTSIASTQETNTLIMPPRSSLGSVSVSAGWKYGGSAKSTAGDSERKRRFHDYLLKKRAKGVASSTAGSTTGST